MTIKSSFIVFVIAAGLVPACVSGRQSSDPEGDAANAQPYGLSDRNYGVLDNEDQVYPWLSPKYDKGIYASSAETAPFRENSLTTENLKRRIQKTSKKSKK